MFPPHRIAPGYMLPPSGGGRALEPLPEHGVSGGVRLSAQDTGLWLPGEDFFIYLHMDYEYIKYGVFPQISCVGCVRMVTGVKLTPTNLQYNLNR